VFARYLALIYDVPQAAVLVVPRLDRVYANPRGEALLSEARACDRLASLCGDVAGDERFRTEDIGGTRLTFAPLFDESASVEAVVALGIDVADMPRALHRFQEPTRSFSRLVHDFPHPVAVARGNGRFDFFNRRWYATMGTRPGTETFSRSFAATDRSAALAAWTTGVAAGVPFRFRSRLATVDGLRWFDIEGQPSHEGRRVVKWIVSAIDVEEEVRAFRALWASEATHRAVAERERAIAERLQRAMLPADLPSTAVCRFDVAYVPAGAETSVGGDWYDAFELRDGRLAVTVGDVTGHGIDAAIAMGTARQLARAVCRDETDPAAVLARVNRMLHGEATIVSALLGIFDPLTGEFRHANAGHPAPLVVRPSGEIAELGGRGMLMGVRREPPAENATAVIEPNSAVVLYTDGVIEASRDVAAGERALRATLAAWALDGFNASAAELQRRVVGEAADDDAAMLVMHVGAARDLDVTIAASPENASRLRRAVERVVRCNVADEDAAFSMTLAVAEAINNAAEHAYEGGAGPVRVVVSARAGVVDARISDYGRWAGRKSEHRGRGLDLMALLATNVDVCRGPDGTVVTLRYRAGDGSTAQVAEVRGTVLS
jgi:serine phosphatase RsbU (regulator of sigma subunit)/anti-sigma regulatory factor (Ser/Thr protein kinase)/PAS domain-containing protein